MSILTRLLTIVFLLGSFLAAEAQSGKKPIKLRIKSEGNGTNITIDDNVSISLEEEADRILAKIIEQGEESLSPAERRTLEDYSRRMRQKHR